MPAVLKRIANTSGAELVFKSNCFEMHGLEHEVRTAVSMVLELDVVKVCASTSRYEIRLMQIRPEFPS